jgi:hypothetical protein
VSELLSMLMPLDTLSGWPAVQDPSALQVIGLLAGWPLLVILIVFVIAKIGTAVQASRGTNIQVTDPLWVGGREGEGSAEAAAIAAGERESAAIASSERDSAAVESGERDSAAVESGERESDVGGAGARW